MTAVEYLVGMICRDVDMYDEEGNVNGVEYWNAFQSCTDLSEYINKAKQMEKQQIIDAYHEGQLSVLQIIEESLIPMGFDSTSDKEDKEDAIEYYNETFKSE